MNGKAFRVGVRTLAEFYYEQGDLRTDEQASQRMQEGLMAHMAVQHKYPEGWQSEVSVQTEEEINGLLLQVYGRIDGYNDAAPAIEEIKSTRLRDPSRIGEYFYPVHWAQAEIYAYIVSCQKDHSDVEVTLRYQSVDGPFQTYTRTYTYYRLRELFLTYAQPYAAWIALLQGWEKESRPTMRALAFPYTAFREGQRDMAAAAYRTLKKNGILLCEAPTGIGKTAASLFPAIKLLGEDKTERIFYLTARTTARKAAEDALMLMRDRGLRIRSVTLTAKEKICFMQGEGCKSLTCPYAAGYFDRRRDALREAVTQEVYDRAAIEELARAYELCPFELSLDLCETADVIICDYNYVFDPVVHLKRFFDGKAHCMLLIDEAHNLSNRAREMLSAEIRYADLLQLRRAIARVDGDRTRLYKATAALIKAVRQLCKGLEMPSSQTEPPNGIYGPLDEFTEAAKEKLGTESEYRAIMLECYFSALGYKRACDDFDETYKAILYNDPHAYRIRLYCIDPAAYLRSRMQLTDGAVLFSGTLSPMEYYARTSGVRFEEGDKQLQLESPFPKEHLLVMNLPIDTRYTMREETAGKIAMALAAMCRAHKGNYMACFPSHAYLQMVYERFAAITRGYIDVIKQEKGMHENERQAFIDRLVPSPGSSLMAFIVMGGIFAEGVDLPGDRLSGAAIVGVGLPSPDYERELLCEMWNDTDEGKAYAYVYPGIERVLQAAGRVIRSENDKGVVLLIDDRYQAEQYRELLPSSWRVRTVENIPSAEKRMGQFWNQY